LQCAVTDHNGHATADLEQVCEEQTPIITSLVTAVQEGVPRAKASIAKLRAAKGEITTNEGAAVAAAQAIFRKHVITLNKRRDVVVAEVGASAASKRKLLDDRINTLDALVLAAEDGTALAACVLEHGSAAEVLLLHPTMVGGLGELAARHTKLLAPTHIGTRLKFTDTMPELGAALEGFGAVDANETDASASVVSGVGCGKEGVVMVRTEVRVSPGGSVAPPLPSPPPPPPLPHLARWNPLIICLLSLLRSPGSGLSGLTQCYLAAHSRTLLSRLLSALICTFSIHAFIF
jgi:hypothetical protein